jgi:putative DNA primase/helicase
MNQVSAADAAELHSSALSDQDISALKVFTCNAPTAKRLTGYSLDGMLIPYFDPFGVPYVGHNGSDFYRLKPRPLGDSNDHDYPKYLSARGVGNRPYFPQNFDWPKFLASKKRKPVIITEGEKKAAALCAAGYPAIGLPGVTAWHDKRERLDNPSDSPAAMVEDAPLTPDDLELARPLPELVEVIELMGAGQKFIILFDSDFQQKYLIQHAVKRLAEWLTELDADPYLCLLPSEVDGRKNGADDLIYRHGKNAIDMLLGKAWPALRRGKDGDGKVLNLPKDNDLKSKAVLAQAAFTRHWAYRPGFGWYKWDGKKWTGADDAQGTYLDKDLIDLADANGWLGQSMALLNGLTRHLKAQLMIGENFWNRSNLIPFQNGVLEGIGNVFRAFSPADYNTRCLTYDYEPAAQSPIWKSFIAQALGDDPNAIELVRSFFRWAITPKSEGKLKLEVCWDLYGKPGTGKGTVLETLQNLLGRDNTGSFDSEMLSNPNCLAQMKDKPCSISFDDSGHLGNVGTFAKLISNEPVGIKLLYQNMIFSSLNTFFIRAYNDFVSTTGGNNSALDRRIVAMRFGHKPKVVDLDLQEKLNGELAGIFNWVWGIGESEMFSRIKNAGSVTAVAKASTERFEANNPVFTFLADTFPNGEAKVKPSDLYKSYSDWCKDSGRHAMNQREFSRKIEYLGCWQTVKSMGYQWWVIPVLDNQSILDNLGIKPKQQDDSPVIEEADVIDINQPRFELRTSSLGGLPVLRVFVLPELAAAWESYLRAADFQIVRVKHDIPLTRISVTNVSDENLAKLCGQNARSEPAWGI